MNLGAVSSVLDFVASGFEEELSFCEQPRVSGAVQKPSESTEHDEKWKRGFEQKEQR